MSSLEEIRAKLNQNNYTKAPSSTSGNSIYPFWNAPIGSTTVLRFLPDANKDNVFFWRERQIIKLPFASVEGNPDLSNVEVEVPCVEMYGKEHKCPILTETRPWWKTDKEDLARLYWPNKTYIYQGFVREGHIQESDPVENPIRRFVISKSIHKIIEAAIMDPDMENLPTNYDHGSDFKIAKKQDGAYASYGTSSFARKETPLSIEERDAVEEFGLYSLDGFLPRQPTQEDLDLIYEMFTESLKGPDSVYKMEWSNRFRPKGVKFSESGEASTMSNTVAPKTNNDAKESVSEGKKETVAPTTKSSTEDALAKLREKMNRA